MKIAHGHNYCASCFSQKPQMRHVDLEAYFDGPAIKQDNGDYLAVDDLVLCEDCIKGAASLVDMFPLADLKKENAEMGETIETKHTEIEELHATITDLTHTLQKISSDKILKPTRRPKIVEV
jgi:hypothetical protein